MKYFNTTYEDTIERKVGTVHTQIDLEKLFASLGVTISSGTVRFTDDNLDLFRHNQATNLKTISKFTYESSLVKQIEFIKSTFSLYNDELAEILGVGRKTLDNWKERGSIPRDKNIKRFFAVHLLAKDWKQNEFPATREAILKIVDDNKNVLELLKAKTLDNEQVLYFGRCLVRDLEEDIDLI